MRTIKASEVVKGMRVRFEASNGDATITTEGVVTKATGAYIAALFFGDYGINLNPDHPVTVLAEPEPEWVEGGLYQLRGEDQWHPVIRRKDRWQGFDGLWTDNHEDAPWEVRPVIVVPAPSDEERADILLRWRADDITAFGWSAWLQRIADHWRNQEATP